MYIFFPKYINCRFHEYKICPISLHPELVSMAATVTIISIIINNCLKKLFLYFRSYKSHDPGSRRVQFLERAFFQGYRKLLGPFAASMVGWHLQGRKYSCCVNYHRIENLYGYQTANYIDKQKNQFSPIPPPSLLPPPPLPPLPLRSGKPT